MNGNAPSKPAPLSYLLAIVGSLLIVFFLVSAMKRYTTPAPLGAARAAERAQFLKEIQAQQNPLAEQYGWVDQGKGLVRLTVERAMELTVQEYQDPAAAHARMVVAAEAKFAPPPEQPSDFE